MVTLFAVVVEDKPFPVVVETAFCGEVVVILFEVVEIEFNDVVVMLFEPVVLL